MRQIVLFGISAALLALAVALMVTGQYGSGMVVGIIGASGLYYSGIKR